MAIFGSSQKDDSDSDDIGPFSHWNDDLDDEKITDLGPYSHGQRVNQLVSVATCQLVL